VPGSYDAHRRQRVQPRSHRRPAHTNLRGQIALGRQSIAGMERTALDERPHVRDDVIRAAGRRHVRPKLYDHSLNLVKDVSCGILAHVGIGPIHLRSGHANCKVIGAMRRPC
jgi:hypothetical protein